MKLGGLTNSHQCPKLSGATIADVAKNVCEQERVLCVSGASFVRRMKYSVGRSTDIDEWGVCRRIRLPDSPNVFSFSFAVAG